VDEGDRTDPGIDRTAGAMLAQAAFHYSLVICPAKGLQALL
jgi:hypothetical protein